MKLVKISKRKKGGSIFMEEETKVKEMIDSLVKRAKKASEE